MWAVWSSSYLRRPRRRRGGRRQRSLQDTNTTRLVSTTNTKLKTNSMSLFTPNFLLHVTCLRPLQWWVILHLHFRKTRQHICSLYLAAGVLPSPGCRCAAFNIWRDYRDAGRLNNSRCLRSQAGRHWYFWNVLSGIKTVCTNSTGVSSPLCGAGPEERSSGEAGRSSGRVSPPAGWLYLWAELPGLCSPPPGHSLWPAHTHTHTHTGNRWVCLCTHWVYEHVRSVFTVMPAAGDPGVLRPLEEGRLTGVTCPSTCDITTQSGLLMFITKQQNCRQISVAVDGRSPSAWLEKTFLLSGSSSWTQTERVVTSSDRVSSWLVFIWGYKLTRGGSLLLQRTF